MFTEAEINTIERWRGVNSKLAYNQLADIYTKYTGDQQKGCGCKASKRTPFLTMFYEWYEENN